MDGDFPWILAGAFLLWFVNLLGGKKRPRVDRPRPRPVESRPTPRAGEPDPTQSEGGQLEELLRALEQRLDPTTAAPRPLPPVTRLPPGPRPGRGPLGRPASVQLPSAAELEERASLEAEPVVESLEVEVRRPERVDRDWLVQAEQRDQARLAQVEARTRPHKSRPAEFDRRIRGAPSVIPVVAGDPVARLTLAQIRQAFIWGEILGRPRADQ